MQFGVIAASALPSEDAMPRRDAFEFVMQTVRAADESGFDAISISHRYLAGPEHQFFQPLVMAAHLLSEFPRMLVATNIFLLSYENPLAVAEEVATLDVIAPGRFLFGIGQGYREDELRAFGIDRGELGRRLEESLRAIRLLWAEGAATFHGDFWHFNDAHIGVKPSSGSGPPILLAADTLKTVALVPQRGGDYWLPSPRHTNAFIREALPVYIKALHRAGKAFTGLPIGRDIAIADSRRQAEQLVEDSFTSYLHFQHEWGQPGERYNLGFDELKTDRIILGTSDDAIAEIVRLHEEFKAEFVTFRTYTPGMDPERALDTIRQLGEEVLPTVRRETGKRSMFRRSKD